jgi:endonuclease/exonuclease/phosphatase family metal-dependent hydrolase
MYWEAYAFRVVRTRRIALAVLAACICLGGGASSASARTVVTMVTYNPHWGEEIDARTGHWTGHLDLRRIAADIRKTGAEVAMLQEVHTYRLGRRVLSEPREIAKLLGWTRGGVRRHMVFRASRPTAIWCQRADGRPKVKFLNGRPGRCREHGNAILSRRPIYSGRFIDLFRPAAAPDIYGAVEGRGAIRAATLVGGRQLWLATTHLARESSVGTCQLRDLLPQLTGLGSLVLAGDFNMQTDTRTDNPRCDGVPPQPLDQPGAVGLVHGEPGGRTYPAHKPREAIDHFFVSPDLRVEGVRPVNNCRRGRCSSDHRPLVGRVLLEP